MRKFIFEKEKLGFKLFKDFHKYDNPDSSFSPMIHIGNFFEIFILEKAKGSFELNGHAITIRDKSVFFVSPYQKKSMDLDISKFKGYHLTFQENFFSNLL